MSTQPPRAEPSLVRANKLELLERLADDLAHEIKNPLHSMVINLEVLKRRIARAEASNTDEMLRYAGVLGGELERVARRVDLLLRLVRPGVDNQAVTVNELIEELLELIELEGSHRGVGIRYEPNVPAAHVRVEREPTRQLILNLVLAALDALGGRGTLWLHTERDAQQVRVHFDVLPAPEGAAAAPLPRAPAASTAPSLEVLSLLAGAIGARIEAGPAPETPGAVAFVLALPFDLA